MYGDYKYGQQLWYALIVVLNIFKTFKAEVELQLGKKIKLIKSDCDGEYYGRYDRSREQRPGSFVLFLRECGIVSQYTMLGKPSMNDMEENIRNVVFEKESVNDIDQALVSITVQETTPMIEDNILRDRSQGILRLSQENYIGKVLERFDMKYSKPGDTRISKGDKFSLKQCPDNDLERNEMYLSDPRMQHWKAIKCMMRYLRRTKGYLLTYWKSEGLEIIGYSDSDFARC
ncbi:hypothetical protein CR513_23722, partial [Mucuna pruriens]